uniref:OTU deubiquitinase with linear linkage specificity b n=1 Tax=Neolamprologus brichardi TaxID=32507 RepID=A0A3Q4H4U9_NEOBR
ALLMNTVSSLRDEERKMSPETGEQEPNNTQENGPLNLFVLPIVSPFSAIPRSVLKVEDRCSLSPVVNILLYSEREWKGNTPKSALIKKGYKEMSQSFASVRRVRGDNYCALRATLYQVLSHSTQLPDWLQNEDVIMVNFHFCILSFRAHAETTSCFRPLHRAAELHSCMQGGEDVPLFCWLLFARDSSDCPRSFLSNHLSHVGLTAGLEQVEMFLLGYALQCTIQVYRLYKADTEEFVTYYPDDHRDDWESVCLVTEDDRHYNVPVVEAAETQKELPSS